MQADGLLTRTEFALTIGHLWTIGQVCHTRGWLDMLPSIVHRGHGEVTHLVADAERGTLISLHCTGEIQVCEADVHQ